MITQLKTRYEQVCAAAGTSAEGADLTVVFDAGQNSDANFAHLAQAGLSYVGSVPASDCPDLLALPASDPALARAGRKLDELAATLARGKARRLKEKVAAEIESITAKPWVRRVIAWELTGGQPRELRLAC